MEAPVEPVVSTPDYNAMTKAELAEYALTLGITLDQSETKAVMIEALLSQVTL